MSHSRHPPVDQHPKRPHSDTRRIDDEYRNGSNGSTSPKNREDREAARQKRRRGFLDDDPHVASSQYPTVALSPASGGYGRSEAGRTGGAVHPTEDHSYGATGNAYRPGINRGVRPDRNRASSSKQAQSSAGALSKDDDLDFDLEDEETETKRIEEQRKKRRELMAKYQESPNQEAKGLGLAPGDLRGVENAANPSTPDSSKGIGTIEHLETGFDLSKGHSSLANEGAISSTGAVGPHIHADVSAADYNPVNDRKKDEAREQHRLQMPVPEYRAEGMKVSAPISVADGVGEPWHKLAASAGNDDYESEYEEVEVDDEDDVDDMFAFGDGLPKKKTIRIKKNKVGAGQKLLTPQSDTALPFQAGLTDNWDDSEGYYRIVLGERIGSNGRFHVFANLGKGMFSEVVRAKDLGEDGKGSGEGEVAIKIVRSQETMYKAGLKEISILKKLRGLDAEDKRHIVRLISHFEHRGHLCMVFESLSMNLREVVKRFGKDVGLNLRAVRAYAHQMFLALSLMRRAEVMHADIKPDNILVNEAKTMLKVCDLGSASAMSEMEITPYLVSRFYRAPEVILGQAYDCSLDTWSIGCTLYELYTGKILFPGRSNNQMLLLIQELKGKFSTRQIRKGRFSGQHFDDSNTFLCYDIDKNTGRETIRKVVLSTTAANDVRSRLLPASVIRGLSDDEVRLTQHFVDLLNKTLELDPAKRITPSEALRHPFLT